MSDAFKTAACVPTADRPDAVRALLENLLELERVPDVVLVADASSSDATKIVTDEMSAKFPAGVLRYERCAHGLVLQRRRGIELIRHDPLVRYLCFLDDDVLLGPEFLSKIVDFFETPAGRPFGCISGYDLVGWEKPFERPEILSKRLHLFSGELRPGRWLYNGYFLALSRFRPDGEVHECDFLPGGHVVWRTEVFDHFLPPAELVGYARGEDKHLSLRAATRYKLAVHGGARCWHLKAKGGRPNLYGISYRRMRGRAQLLRDCDPRPTVRRYLAFLAFHLFFVGVQLATRLVKGQFRDLDETAGSFAGWLSCIVAPPRRTGDALTRGKGFGNPVVTVSEATSS